MLQRTEKKYHAIFDNAYGHLSDDAGGTVPERQ
jgi:hypothetical protein